RDALSRVSDGCSPSRNCERSEQFASVRNKSTASDGQTRPNETRTILVTDRQETIVFLAPEKRQVLLVVGPLSDRL
ncbi:hypothetical protein, partial [Natronococcus sp.]|uniref:hypothetical protein n=1 Tax=Natronococcus sp. TaxID=35747 RepID=UPI003A4D413B